jgi:mRNA interferase RelE/StbE
MRFRVEISSRARRDIRRFDQQIRNRLESAINGLAENPYPRGSLKLKGYDRTWRIRVGNFRVLYDVYEDLVLVVVLKADRRGEDTYRI